MYKIWKPALLKLPINYTLTTAAAAGQPGTQQRVSTTCITPATHSQHSGAKLPGLASHFTSLLHTDKATHSSLTIHHFIFKSKIKTKFVRFRPRLAEGRDGLGRRTGGEGGCRVLPGAQDRGRPAGGLRPRQESTLAAHHTRQGVATSKRSVSTVHQMVPRVPRGP